MALIVNVISARNIPTEWFEKVDPYVQVRYQKETKQTRADNQSGSDPAFNQALTFRNRGPVGELEVAVYDDDVLFDDFLAKAVVDLPYISKFESVRGYFPLVDASGKPHGEIKLEITFLEDC